MYKYLCMHQIWENTPVVDNPEWCRMVNVDNDPICLVEGYIHWTQLRMMTYGVVSMNCEGVQTVSHQETFWTTGSWPAKPINHPIVCHCKIGTIPWCWKNFVAPRNAPKSSYWGFARSYPLHEATVVSRDKLTFNTSNQVITPVMTKVFLCSGWQ